ncbi:MAG: hypothetical protein DHS20C02_13040 [Micavibrio sp.]|nr:MAG: hypothetical protein DHS20C02_13040 [Micavibrio sp.]
MLFMVAMILLLEKKNSLSINGNFTKQGANEAPAPQDNEHPIIAQINKELEKGEYSEALNIALKALSDDELPDDIWYEIRDIALYAYIYGGEETRNNQNFRWGLHYYLEKDPDEIFPSFMPN